MNRRVLLVAAGATLVGLLVLSGPGWLVASPLLATAAWLIAVERSVGVARFVRFDPWPPRTKRGRRQRAALIGVVLLATLPLGIVIGFMHPDPPSVLIGLYVFLAVYTWWAVSFVRAHAVDDVIEVKVHE